MPRKVKGIRRKGAGWQVFVRVRGQLVTQQYQLDTPVSEMQDWRRDQRQTIERDSPAPSRGTFESDATLYLTKVKAMPSYADRARDIGCWSEVFRGRRRRTIKSHEIRGARDAWLADLAASTVNHRLRALSNLWTVLDGRRAPNPVREVPEAKEPDPEPRAISFELARAILDALPDRGYATKDQKRPPLSKTKARLRVEVWTGLTHIELAHLERRDWDEVAGTLFVRGRQKGGGGASRLIPMTREGRSAMTAFNEANAWGPFQRSSLHQSFRRACQVVAKKKTTSAETKVILAGLRPYDFRHTHATAVYRASGDAHAAATVLGHRSRQTTDRYIKGAVSERVQSAMKQFEKATRKRKAS